MKTLSEKRKMFRGYRKFEGLLTTRILVPVWSRKMRIFCAIAHEAAKEEAKHLGLRWETLDIESIKELIFQARRDLLDELFPETVLEKK